MKPSTLKRNKKIVKLYKLGFIPKVIAYREGLSLSNVYVILHRMKKLKTCKDL